MSVETPTKADDEQETGEQTLEEAAAAGQTPEEPEEFIAGAAQLNLMAGGETPTSSALKLRGGSVAVEGAFEKGDTIRLLVEARVSEVHFIDTVDAHGYVTRTERRHIARIESTQRS